MASKWNIYFSLCLNNERSDDYFMFIWRKFAILIQTYGRIWTYGIEISEFQIKKDIETRINLPEDYNTSLSFKLYLLTDDTIHSLNRKDVILITNAK